LPRKVRHQRRAYRPVVELLEDRRLLSPTVFIEDFQDGANPQLPGFDSSGVFQHTATSERIVSEPSAPSPPHALEVFKSIPPHIVTFGPGIAVDDAGVWASTASGFGFVEFVGQKGTMHFDFPRQSSGFVFQDTTGAGLAQITEIHSGGGEILFDDLTIHTSPVNHPPIANPDSASATAGLPVKIDVLANDSSAPDIGETLTVTAVTEAAAGAVAINGAG